MKIIYIATGSVDDNKVCINSLIQSINYSKIACTGYFVNASSSDVGRYLFEAKIITNCKPMSDMILAKDNELPLEKIINRTLEWCHKNKSIDNYYLIVVRPLLFALNAINELANEVDASPNVNMITCKLFKLKDMTQERLNETSKAAAMLKTIDNYFDNDMNMPPVFLRSDRDILNNLYNLPSITCQRSICGEVI